MLGFVASAPPIRVAPAQLKLVKVFDRVMLFPADPMVVAVTVTTLSAEVDDTPTELPFPSRLIAAARLLAVSVVVAPIEKKTPESELSSAPLNVGPDQVKM